MTEADGYGYAVYYWIPIVIFGPVVLTVFYYFGIRELIKMPAQIRAERAAFKLENQKFEKERARKRGTMAVGTVRTGNKTYKGYAIQGFLYVLFAVFMGYFASSPSYQYMPEKSALIKLSLSHPGQRIEECHKRTREELLKLAANMRAAQDCGRERFPVTVELTLDDKVVFSGSAKPGGLASDGPSLFYKTFVVPEGTHQISLKLREAGGEAYNFEGSQKLTLTASQVLVASFDSETSKVYFK